MKCFTKLLRTLRNDENFRIEKRRRRTTLKIIYINTGDCYMCHPGEAALKPLRSWINKMTAEN